MQKQRSRSELRGDGEADQCLCFCYTDSTIPLLPKCEISSLYASCVIAQPGLCRTWSETLKTCFLTTRLILILTLISSQVSFLSNTMNSLPLYVSASGFALITVTVLEPLHSIGVIHLDHGTLTDFKCFIH